MEDDEAELTLNKVEEEMMVSTVMFRTLGTLNNDSSEARDETYFSKK